MSRMGSHLLIVCYLFNLISAQLSVDKCVYLKIQGPWGRFLILIGGASFVIAAVVIVACFVSPGCWGFKYLQKEEKKKKQKSIEKIQSKTTNNFKLKSGYYWLENNYIIYETGPRGFEAKISKVNETPPCQSKEKVFNFKCAPLLIAPTLYSAAEVKAPKLEIKLFYCSLDEEKGGGRLTVQIASASFLSHREYISTLDPFVSLEILHNKWSLQKNERIIHVVKTRAVKNSLNPTFDETYTFDVKKIEMKNWCLKFTILDDDRLTKVTPILEKRIYLKDVKNLTANDCHIPLSLEMQEVMESMGALFFGISYLPTAQRLNISIIKASKLKHQSLVQSLIEFYPYVRVVMVDNHGKCVKKKKTCFRHKEENPVFNHSLIFDLSISNLEQTVFLVLLCTKVLNRTSSDDSSLDGDIETSLSESKDKVLGSIVLGRNVKCTRARDHWVTVMQNPRKMISVWHDLR